jgi:hypothetical protein
MTITATIDIFTCKAGTGFRVLLREDGGPVTFTPAVQGRFGVNTAAGRGARIAHDAGATVVRARFRGEPVEIPADALV